MKCNDSTLELEAHGSFDMLLRGKSLVNNMTQTRGFTLLLCGPPGAGKTTMGLYLLHDIFQKLKDIKDKRPKALMLSLVESAEQIAEICNIYGFNFGLEGDQSSVHLIPCRFAAGEVPDFKKITSAAGLESGAGDLLLVDGVSILGTHEKYRSELLSFLDQIKERFFFTILIAEEYRESDDNFLEYGVDGIISEKVNQITRSRSLEITKLRWHDYYLGAHSFKLQDKRRFPKGPGVLFFPSVNCLIGERICKQDNKETVGLTSGVDGFDKIVKLEGGPFQLGEQVLLVGPSGSGKFHFGTQFLEAAASVEQSIYISFIRSFHDISSRIDSLSLSKEEDSDRICDCLHFSSTGFVVDEVLCAIHNILTEKEPKVTRLFIDGISALRCHFETDEKFERFLRSFLQLLSTFSNVAALISYYTPKVFSSYSEIDIPASERFSMVIGFNFQEQHNRLIPGIVALRSRISGCDTSLKVPKIVDGKYTIDHKAGWPRVGLLGGEREQVHEEVPFVKLFFENRSEDEIVRPPFQDFEERYPQGHIFRMVAKHNPQPSHWSFLGYAGPGHSNTKLADLRKYVMDVLREQGVFGEVPLEIKSKLEDRFEDGFLWKDIGASDESPCVMVPFYADVGVLVYREDCLRTLQGKNEGEDVDLPETWDSLLDMVGNFATCDNIRHLFIIPNTSGDIKNFVSFFFELCWTYGWDFPDTNHYENNEVLEKLEEWVKGKYFDNTVSLLKKMVEVGKDKAIPNPNVGGHYHESVFARRWFSKIHLRPEDAKKRAELGDKAHRFGIMPLPGVENEGKVIPGISNVDLYCLAIIREALAPETAWMLASSLFDDPVDEDRVRRKRGIPISQKLFRTRIIKDNLGAPPPPPEGKPEFYDDQEKLFKKYVDTLETILDSSSEEQPRFRRTADIPKFFYLEELLSRQLPRLFELSIKESDVKDEILKGLKDIYSKKSQHK